ncbi:DUF4169 family protein [Roseicyclus mahoneyensis]|uniref:Uncharacterized protein DUF4169 n=1 Tax=Roseicyclus mahoneyensis TaxID=164332 RepID=A0A316GPV7_9RHOB|nr:DUF4169 family protein [Roseicyclus mahoneyensis]PWK62441.1 uncharacterized protein DUF4169 [Roseicyclus mahoneyensis]
MTGKVVNLTRARKTRARDDKRQKADANAAKFGLTKAERATQAQAADKAARHLDAHRREDAEE